MNIFKFASPEALWLLLVVPLVVVLHVVLLAYRGRKLKRLGNPATLQELMPDYSKARGWIKLSLFAAALALFILAMARPQTGSKLGSRERQGREIVLVVDVSNSMLAEDVEPSRMARTRYSITQLVENMKEDGIGIVAFADESEVLLPITSDYTMALAKVKRLAPSLIAAQGTDLGKAIETALLSFSTNTHNTKSRVMILITDGEDHDDKALAAAERAKQMGVVVCCIGIGTPEGKPLKIDGKHIEDEEGKMVLTKLNEQLLQQIAATTEGIYTRSRNEDFGLQGIIERLNEMEQSTLSEIVFAEYEEQYQWFLGAGVLLLLVEMLILARRNPLLRNVKLFERNE
ncbi:MAG: VWA domain-containing protein [Alistipes sp.]|nr:VWA domain-containing protein [Alistipes sp.]